MKQLLFILFFYFTTGIFAQTETDSINFLISQKKGIEKVDFLNDLSFEAWTSSPQKGLIYANDALQLAKKMNYPKGIGWALNGIGLNNLGLSLYSQALESLNESSEVFNEIGDNEGLARSYGIMAICYRKMSEFDLALKNSLKSLEIYEKITDEKGTAIAMNNIANIYMNLKNNEKALEYYNKSLSIIEKTGDKSYYAGTLNNIGVVYQQLNNNEKALEYYHKVLVIREETGNKYGVAACLNNIGTLKDQIEDYEGALKYFEDALKIKQEIGDRSGEANILNNIGGIYNKQAKYDDAFKSLKRAYKIASEINAKNILSDNYEHFSELYTFRKDYKKALEYYQKYSVLKDSIYNDTSSEQIAEFQTKYETQKKEKENILLQQNNEIQRLEISNQKSIIRLFIVLSVLIISLVAFILLLFLNKKKANQLLEEKNEVITKQKDQLSETLVELKEAVSTKNKFFSIIAHDLKNPFNTILGMSRLILDNYVDFSDSERKKFIGEIYKSSQNTYRLLENLLTWANIQQHRIEVKNEELNLKNLVNENINLYMLNAEMKKIEIKNNIPSDVVVHADRFTVSTTIANLISNSIKFTPFNGKVSICSERKNSHVEVTICDNGIGMSQQIVEKLFKIDESFSTIGTNNENGTGLGLVLCKEFIELNGGEIEVDSEEGNGSTFRIKLNAV